MKEQNGKEYFTVKEIVELVGVSKQSVYKWTEQLKENVPNIESDIIQIEGIQYLSRDILEHFKQKAETIKEIKTKASNTRDINQLEKENEELKKENDSLKAKIKDLEKELQTSRNKIDSLLDEIIESGKEQRRLNERILSIEYHPTETRKETDSKQLEDKEEEIKRLKEELENERNRPRKKGFLGLFG